MCEFGCGQFEPNLWRVNIVPAEDAPDWEDGYAALCYHCVYRLISAGARYQNIRKRAPIKIDCPAPGFLAVQAQVAEENKPGPHDERVIGPFASAVHVLERLAAGDWCASLSETQAAALLAVLRVHS